MHYCTGHSTVDAIATLHFQGNIIPHTWYQHIGYATKRGHTTDHLACAILADIVYWYRPSEVRDETSGHLIGYRKKFADDKLQRSPEAFAALLNCTPKVVRESLRLLEKLELIDIELRSVTTAFGVIPKTMFIGLNAERVLAITSLSSKAETLEKSFLPKSVGRSAEIGRSVCRNGIVDVPKSGSCLYIENSHRLHTELPPTPTEKTEDKKQPQPIRRRIHLTKGTECSNAQDPWMDGINPHADFKEWVYQLRRAEKFESASLPNAAAEIRNDYLRANDLWEEFQRSTKGVVGGVKYSESDYEKLLASSTSVNEFIWGSLTRLPKQESERRIAWLESQGLLEDE